MGMLQQRKSILHSSGMGVFTVGNLEARRTVCVSSPVGSVYAVSEISPCASGREEVDDYFIIKMATEC